MNARTVIAKTTAIIAVPAVIAGVCVGLSAFGVPVDLPTRDDETAPASTVDTTAAPEGLVPAPSPAAVAVKEMFDQIDTAWKPQGRRVAAAGLPHPLTCVTPAPSLSLSQTYTTKTGVGTQVTITSYPAGLGAWVFDQMPAKARDCKPSSTSMTVMPSTGIGVQSARYIVSWSGNRASIEVVRRGDVLTFVATTSPAPATAKAVDGVVAAHMNRCATQDSTVAAAFRNPATAKTKYKPFTTVEKVTREPAATPSPPAGVDAVAVPAKTYKVPTVTRPEPRAYPVWPDLPKDRAVPNPPEAPKPQKTVASIDTLTADVTGPGCGWAWMTSAVAPFDEVKAEEVNDAAFAKATKRLAKDEKRWLTEVVGYWVAYADYRATVISYRDYAQKVADVEKAWKVIDAQWATYWAEHDAWTKRKAARERFDSQKKTAKDAYDELLDQCLELAETPIEPDVEEDEPDIMCPPERPSILDQKAPKVGKEPTKPKNPRPDA
ncbi:hypothetical protein [Aeromicrobium sp. 179-A 4D2 NHS]|uniref:hypothetical protein n=1 Tax=Aeromicrobium sp. 179-A 4D2 NHS TaxID=3142375 RepID=UPI0039A03812